MSSASVAALMVFLCLAAFRVAVRSRRRVTVTGRLVAPVGGHRQLVIRWRGHSPLWRAPAWVGPLLEKWLEEWLEERLEEMAVNLGPEEVGAAKAWWAWVVGTSVSVGAALLVAGPALAVIVAVAMAAAPVVAWRMLRHRSQAALDAALPGAMESIARALRSGASLRQALAEAGREMNGTLGEDIRRVVLEVEEGAELVRALEEWAARRPLVGVRLVVAALSLGAETGGARAQAVDGLAATLRQSLAARAEARALATQARLSAWVMALAPVAFCAIASVVDARTAAFLFTTGPGLGCVAAGLALDTVGALWMARITRLEP